MVLYMYIQQVYKNSVDGIVFTAEFFITMSVNLNRTLSVQGAAGLPNMCTKPVGDVWVVPQWSCTAPYSTCLKVLLAADCSPPSVALP